MGFKWLRMKRGGGDPRDTKHKIDARRLCDGPMAGETGRTRAVFTKVR